MEKQRLLEKLREFVSDKEEKVVGQKIVASFLIYFLEHRYFTSERKYEYWQIDHYLPSIIVDAFEELRKSTEETIVCFRKMYEEDVAHEVPSLIDIEVSSISERILTIQHILCPMLSDILEDPSITMRLDTYCNAQRYVLKQMFDRFVRMVYNQGLREIISECKLRGMSGSFGETELRTYITAGRILFTFARRKEGETILTDCRGVGTTRLPYVEQSVSFIAEDEDPMCLSAGLQSIYTDFPTAFDMIDEVTKCCIAYEINISELFQKDEEVLIM